MAEIEIEVVYAQAGEQRLLCLRVPVGTTVREAALRSAMDEYFLGLDLSGAPLGIFGKLVAKPEERLLEAGDRVEIYRLLLADPKEVRKARAARAKAARQAD